MTMEYSVFYPLEIKAAGNEDGNEGRFTGYASVFGGPPDLQRDIIAPGAFAKTLRKSHGRVPILMGHIMARIVGFGVKAVEDDKGLLVTGEFTLDSDEGKNAYATAKHAAKLGHSLGLSIGYMIGGKDGATFDDKTGIRTIHEIDLLEYSIAAVPACPRARVAEVKNAGNVREAERFLKQLGLTGDEARKFISVCRTERDANAGADGNNSDDPERDANDNTLNRAMLASLAGKSVLFELHKVKGA